MISDATYQEWKANWDELSDGAKKMVREYEAAKDEEKGDYQGKVKKIQLVANIKAHDAALAPPPATLLSAPKTDAKPEAPEAGRRDRKRLARLIASQTLFTMRHPLGGDRAPIGGESAGLGGPRTLL